MTRPKTRLELTWIGKEHRPKLESRISVEQPDLSCHAARRVPDANIFDNELVHGDNLLAIKPLEQGFALTLHGRQPSGGNR